MIYGKLPECIGYIDVTCEEMLFWLYCPIATPSRYMTLPDNLRHFKPLVMAAMRHEDDVNYGLFENGYVYLTAKTLWVSGEYIGNRPGWHSDGFGTDDVNYVWSDRAPTEFLKLEEPRSLSSDCRESMEQMTDIASFSKRYGSSVVTYPDKHLLRLDQSVIHRSPVKFSPGMRTFVKVSFSNDQYDLKGNSVNHKLDLDWQLVDRKLDRNHPASVTV